MADKMNFQEALNVKVGSIERPPKIPQGTYVVKVNKQPFFAKTGEDDRYETCDFTLGLIQPTDNVDAADLEEYGPITNSSIQLRFMFDSEDKSRFERSLFFLKRFIEEHLLVDGADKMPLKKALADTVNHQCMVDVVWSPNPKDPEEFFVNAGKTMPV